MTDKKCFTCAYCCSARDARYCIYRGVILRKYPDDEICERFEILEVHRVYTSRDDSNANSDSQHAQ